MIQAFLDSYAGDTVCSKQLYKEALNHTFDEPKQWEIREITNEDRCKFVLWVGNKRLTEPFGSVALIMHLKFVFCGGVYVAKTLCAQWSVFWCTPK